jgi:hypothetical protein
MHWTWRQIVIQNPGWNNTTEAMENGILQHGWVNGVKLDQTNMGGKEFISIRLIPKWISQQYCEWEYSGSAKYHSHRRHIKYKLNMS